MKTIADDQTNLKRQMRLLDSHRAIFKIPRDSQFAKFENLAKSAGGDFFVECSVKLTGGKTYPARFNLSFARVNHRENLEKAVAFARDVIQGHGGIFNTSMLDAIVTPDFDHGALREVFTGIDLRDQARETRAKVWMVIQTEYGEKIDAILGICQADEFMRRLVSMRNRLLIGFDFGMEGETRIKLYLATERRHWRERPTFDYLARHVAPDVVSRADQAIQVYLAYATGRQERVIHFFGLDDVREFAEALGAPRLIDLVNRTYREGVSNHIVSVSEKELAAKQLHQINFYYTSEEGCRHLSGDSLVGRDPFGLTDC